MLASLSKDWSAAALANEGLETWVYSIAPFCYARAFEQVRNDVCFHNTVKIVGNGGGYGYGVMGPTTTLLKIMVHYFLCPI